MSQIVVVKDSTNNKLRELESNASGELKVTVPDVSGLALEATQSSLNAKVIACDTSNISGTVAVSAVAGSVACTHAALPLPSGASTEASLSALNGKVTACDTGSISGTVAVSAVAGSVACTHASLPLPSGAATETSVSSSASSLTTLASAVTAGVVQVSAGVSSSSSQSAFSSAPIAPAGSITSSGMDIDSYKEVCVFGSTNNLQDNVMVEVSDDDITYYELNNVYITVDYSSGNFGSNFSCSARYIRLKRTNNSGSTESITAIISAK